MSMRPFHHISLTLDQKNLLARFWQSASQSWQTQRAWVAALGGFLIVVVLSNRCCKSHSICGIGIFFDALERKDAAAVWAQARLFVPLAAASIFLAATSVWGRMTAQRGWREALTRHVIDRWLEKDRFRHLNHHLTKGTENPEYRIAVDYA